MLTQSELDQMREQWERSLPDTEVAGEPFYTLMKFEGDRNTGEVFSYPGVNLSFGRQAMCVTLFPNLTIGRECESYIRLTHPEWRLVGVSASFLELLVGLVKFQEMRLTVSTTPTDSILCDVELVTELAEAIREKGFSKELLMKHSE